MTMMSVTVVRNYLKATLPSHCPILTLTSGLYTHIHACKHTPFTHEKKYMSMYIHTHTHTHTHSLDLAWTWKTIKIEWDEMAVVFIGLFKIGQ